MPNLRSPTKGSIPSIPSARLTSASRVPRMLVFMTPQSSLWSRFAMGTLAETTEAQSEGHHYEPKERLPRPQLS